MPSDTPPPAHPFGPLLEADEPLLWLVRPDSTTYQAQQAKLLSYIFGFSLAAILLLGVWLVKPQTVGVAAFGFIWLAVICIAVMKLTGSGNEEWSVTWYALTPRRLLRQSFDTDAEGCLRIGQVALTDLHRLRLRKRYAGLGMTVGTITCYTAALFVSGHFTLNAIENPDAVLALIEESRAKIAVGAQ